MSDLMKSVVKHSPGVPSSLLDAHLRRMPETYSERYAPAEIGRHLRMLSRLSDEQPVDVEVKPLGGPNYEVCVVGFDRTGVLAAITTALATDKCDVFDLQLATYLPADLEGEPENEPPRFVDVIRVSLAPRR